MKKLEDYDREPNLGSVNPAPKPEGEKKKSPMVSILLAFAAALVIYAIIDAM